MQTIIDNVKCKQMCFRKSAGSAVVKTVSGKVLVMPDSNKASFAGMSHFGVSNQNGTPAPDNLVPIVSAGQELGYGNQLFNVDDSDAESAYIDGSYAINANSAWTTTGYIPVSEEKEYVLSGLNNHPNSDSDHFLLYDSEKTLLGGKSINIASTGYPISFEGVSYVRFSYKNVDVDTVMFNEGSAALPWEPYTGGVPVAVDVGIDTVVLDGNLLDLSTCEYGYIDGSGVLNSASVSDVASDYIRIEGQAFSVSVNTVIANIGIALFDASKNIVSRSNNNNTQSVYIEANTEYEYVRVWFNNSVNQFMDTLGDYEPMINFGTALPYEPYTEPQTIHSDIVLPGIHVTDETYATFTDENGQMWCADTREWERGVDVQRIGVGVFDGSDDEGWYAQSTNTSGNYRWGTNLLSTDIVPTQSVNTVADILCDQYQKKSFNNVYDIQQGIAVSTGGAIFVYEETSATSTIATWKARLAENPITVQYILAEPIETPIPEAELAAWRALHTNKPTTTVMQSADAWMAAEYYSGEGEEVPFIPYRKVYADGILIFSAGNTVTYYVDGVVYQEKVDSGNSCLSPTSFTPEKDGYIFFGWSDSPDSTEVLTEKVMDADPITLYAVFRAAQIYAGYGTLADGVTLSGLTEYDANGGGLYKSAWNTADKSSATTATAKICGVDLTGFSKLSVKHAGSGMGLNEPCTVWCTYGAGGHSKIFWGIDSASASSTLLAQGTVGVYNKEVEFSGEMDVSGYTGVHDIVFYLSADCNYGGSGSTEKAALYLQEVKLS